jgi:hypothetical protein
MLPVELGFHAAGALNESDNLLIWELVANISPPAKILTRHGLTAADLKLKMKDGMFIAAYREAKGAWEADLNVQQRVKLKSALLLESSLVDIMLIVKDPNMSASFKLEATKQLAAMGEVGTKKQGGAEGSAFKLTINLGDSPAKSVTIDGHSIPATSQLTADAAEG